MKQYTKEELKYYRKYLYKELKKYLEYLECYCKQPKELRKLR